MGKVGRWGGGAVAAAALVGLGVWLAQPAQLSAAGQALLDSLEAGDWERVQPDYENDGCIMLRDGRLYVASGWWHARVYVEADGHSARVGTGVRHLTWSDLCHINGAVRRTAAKKKPKVKAVVDAKP